MPRPHDRVPDEREKCSEPRTVQRLKGSALTNSDTMLCRGGGGVD